jgi:hypothetical protein
MLQPRTTTRPRAGCAGYANSRGTPPASPSGERASHPHLSGVCSAPASPSRDTASRLASLGPHGLPLTGPRSPKCPLSDGGGRPPARQARGAAMTDKTLMRPMTITLELSEPEPGVYVARPSATTATTRSSRAPRAPTRRPATRWRPSRPASTRPPYHERRTHDRAATRRCSPTRTTCGASAAKTDPVLRAVINVLCEQPPQGAVGPRRERARGDAQGTAGAVDGPEEAARHR